MTGAGVSDEVRRRITALFGGRCSYCRSPLFLLRGSDNIEHIIPRVADGPTVEANLCLSCSRCNLRKRTRTSGFDALTRRTVALFHLHPQRQRWPNHFEWNNNFTLIIGRTAAGRVTEKLLRLNDDEFRSRKIWIKAGWHPE